MRIPEVPRKQRHTAHRIFERLRDEHGFSGGYTIVKDYVQAGRQTTCEAFVPLHHPPGHAQVDFGEAVVEIGGRHEKVAYLLPDPTALRCLVREGLSEGDDGGLPGRTRQRLRPPRRGSALDPL